MLSKMFGVCSLAVVCFAQQGAGVYTAAQATAGVLQGGADASDS